MPLSELEKKIGYKFKNKALLHTAVTHSSYANENKGRATCNERLEFLGDSVLGFVVADYLYNTFPNTPEGKLTKTRAALVCEKSLCEFSKKLDIGHYLMLSNGERHSGGSERPSILADAFEAIIAAIYMDSGIEEARKFILNFITPAVRNIKDVSFKDYKTKLQEIVQQNPGEKISYRLVNETGPDHNKHFVIEVCLNHNVIGKGGGRSKKEAEQQAAREALELMGY